MKYTLYILFLSSLVLQCTSNKSTHSEQAFNLIDSPAGEVSGQPQLFTDHSGGLWLSWVEPLENGLHQLLYSYYDGTSWRTPAEAARGENWFVNWADLPGVKPLPDGSLLSWYLVSNSESVYGYDIHMRIKPVSGNWGEAFMPHFDGTPTQHGFVSVEVFDDYILAAWLDGRETIETEPMESGHNHGHEETGAMTLRAVKMAFDGTILEEMLIDDFVCSCCPTAMVSVPDGIITAYRNRTPHEIRDIYISTYDGSQWSTPFNVNDDNWEINACPVNGPSLASFGITVAVAWYTGAGGDHKVNVAFSEDGGMTTSKAIVIDDQNPVGRVGVVMPDENTAFVSWQGSDDTGKPALLTATIRLNGEITHHERAVYLPDSMPPVTPKLAMTPSHYYITWIEQNKETGHKQIKIAQKKHAD